MKLIVILLCLGLERFLHLGILMQRFNWLPLYAKKMQQGLAKTPLLRGILAPITMMLPILLVVAIAYYFFGSHHPLFKFLLSIVILLYCLGPEDFFKEHKKMITDTTSEIFASSSMPITQNIYWQAQTRFFAVLLWFVILGPMGALIYRMASLFSQNKAGAYFTFAEEATQLHGVLAWLPSRVISLGYALVGNFTRTFTFWLEQVVTGWQNNQTLIEQSGRIAQGIDPTAELTVESAPAAVALIERMLIIFIVAVALFTLGAWLQQV